MQSRQNTATIDGTTVRIRDGQTILQAARKAGIYIPTLCYLENIQAYGGCRLCIVEVKGQRGYPTACTTPLEAGMEIRTKTPGLKSLRREILELILSEHPYTCLVCKDREDCTEFMHTTRKVTTITGCNFCTSNGDCELQDLVKSLELKEIRYPVSYRGLPVNRENPFYDLDYNLCILCGRCVRICNEERNSHVLEFVQRGNKTIIGTAFNDSQMDAGCEFCGACVDVCPTGSISEKMGKWAGLPDRSAETRCLLCPVGCSININTRGNRIVNIGPKPGERTNSYQICLRAKFLLPDLIHHPDRLMTPLVRKNDKWIETDWEAAIEYSAENLQKYRGKRFGAVGSVQDTMEDNYMLQKFTRAVMHSNNIDLFTSSNDRKLGPLMHSLNLLNVSPGIDGILNADTLLMIGTDASLSHPIIENRIRKAYREGKRIIYANDCPTRTSKFTTSEIHYKPGTSYYFLFLLAYRLSGKSRKEYGYRQALEQCDVDDKQLEEIITRLEKSRKLFILAGESLIRQEAGMMVIRALYDIQYLQKQKGSCWILIPGDEGNHWAAIRAGVHPDLLPGFEPLKNGNAIHKYSTAWKTRLRKTPGLSFNEILKNTSGDGIGALMVSGDIYPDQVLEKLEFCIQINMFRTAFSEFADVVLPVSSFLEREGHILGPDGKPLKLKRAIRGPENMKSASEIISMMAAAMNGKGFDRGTSGEIWKEMRKLDIPYRKTEENGMEKFLPLELLQGKEQVKKPAKPAAEQSYYRYRGNDLTLLIPELKELIDHRESRLNRK